MYSDKKNKLCKSKWLSYFSSSTIHLAKIFFVTSATCVLSIIFIDCKAYEKRLGTRNKKFYNTSGKKQNIQYCALLTLKDYLGIKCNAASVFGSRFEVLKPLTFHPRHWKYIFPLLFSRTIAYFGFVFLETA